MKEINSGQISRAGSVLLCWSLHRHRMTLELGNMCITIKLKWPWQNERNFELDRNIELSLGGLCGELLCETGLWLWSRRK